jgi:hypothetical protein
MIASFLALIVFPQTFSFPEKVDNPRVMVTHRLVLDEFPLPLFWGQEKVTILLEEASIKNGVRANRGETLQEDSPAMLPVQWENSLKGFTALENTVVTELPESDCLILRWSPDSLLVTPLPGFMFHPPADGDAAQFLVESSLRTQWQQWPNRTLSLDNPDLSLLNQSAPVVGEVVVSEHPALTMWNVERYPERRTLENHGRSRPVNTPGRLMLHSPEPAGSFQCQAEFEGRSTLVIAKSIDSNLIWLWFEVSSPPE